MPIVVQGEALPPLATAADLTTRGVDVTNTALADEMLLVASAIVRGAAQSPIMQTTSTVTLWATGGDQYLDLPGKPVTAVSVVVRDGVTLDASDYRLVHGRLWRAAGWSYGEPLRVDVTLTHGFLLVPANIRQLVCDLAIRGMAEAAEGAHNPNVIAEKIDDYSVTFAQGYESVATAMELPRLTKHALRKQYGGGAAMVVAR